MQHAYHGSRHSFCISKNTPMSNPQPPPKPTSCSRCASLMSTRSSWSPALLYLPMRRTSGSTPTCVGRGGRYRQQVLAVVDRTIAEMVLEGGCAPSGRSSLPNSYALPSAPGKRVPTPHLLQRAAQEGAGHRHAAQRQAGGGGSVDLAERTGQVILLLTSPARRAAAGKSVGRRGGGDSLPRTSLLKAVADVCNGNTWHMLLWIASLRPPSTRHS